jgi:DNA-directed RNA polymerase subunit beta
MITKKILAELNALQVKHQEILDRLTERLADLLLGEKLPLDIIDSQTGRPIIPANRKITKTLLRMVASNWMYVEIDPSPIRNKVLEVIFKFEPELVELQAELNTIKNSF